MTRPTLPASIPDLLRRGSPCVATGKLYGERVIIEGCDIDSDAVLVLRASTKVGAAWMPPGDLALDLSDPTGRAHAAWWLAAQSTKEVDAALVRYACRHVYRPEERDLGPARNNYIAAFLYGRSVSDASIYDFRRVVLAVAGLEVSDAG